jgi:hypothetical protein
MKIIGILMTISLLVVLTFAAFVETQKGVSAPIVSMDDPLHVVKKYCELSSTGDLEKIKELIVEYPEEYFVAFDKSNDLYRQSKGIPIPEKKVEEPTEGVIRGVSANKIKVSPFVMPELIKRDQSYISEVTNVWINGKESRVRLVMKSTLSDRYRRETDFMLYQTSDGWKIFSEDGGQLFPVYGVPENELNALIISSQKYLIMHQWRDN